MCKCDLSVHAWQVNRTFQPSNCNWHNGCNFEWRNAFTPCLIRWELFKKLNVDFLAKGDIIVHDTGVLLTFCLISALMTTTSVTLSYQIVIHGQEKLEPIISVWLGFLSSTRATPKWHPEMKYPRSSLYITFSSPCRHSRLKAVRQFPSQCCEMGTCCIRHGM